MPAKALLLARGVHLPIRSLSIGFKKRTASGSGRLKRIEAAVANLPVSFPCEQAGLWLASQNVETPRGMTKLLPH